MKGWDYGPEFHEQMIAEKNTLAYFILLLMNGRNKLECLSLANLSSLV
jgi:hypothetical protein